MPCGATSLEVSYRYWVVVCRIIYPHTPCRRIAYPPELSLVQAPSLWEGWGGLLFVNRIIYPYTLCRRIAYPPERKGNTACARACSLSKQSGERKANNNSAQGTALGESMYQGYAPLGQNHLASPHLVCVQLFFCPFRALLPAIPCSQSVALG